MLLCEYLNTPTTFKHGNQWLKRIFESLRFILHLTNLMLSIELSILLAVKIKISLCINNNDGGYSLNTTTTMEKYVKTLL